MIVVTIRMSWLLFDIMNETFLRGRCLQDRENYRETSRVFATADDRDQERVLRSIKKGVGMVRAVAAEYLRMDDVQSDNVGIDATEDIVINLWVPQNFNRGMIFGLTEGVHDCLKNMAVSEWYRMTNKEESGEYREAAEKGMHLIRECLGQRVRPTVPSRRKEQE